MRAGPDGLRFSPSDLNFFADCEHLAWLEGQAARGLRVPDAAERDPMSDLLTRRGLEHEKTYLAACALPVTRIPYDPGNPAPAVQATREAMERGDPVIYQGVLEHGRWLGIADFLERVETPSDLGAWSYEAADTKLGRTTKAYYLLQLSLYSELIAQVQGTPPVRMHAILAGQVRDSYACRDFGAYFRALRERFVATVEAGAEPSYPLPVEHCAMCRWARTCERRREADDHLCHVANIRRTQMARLAKAGVTTMAQLAGLPESERVPRIPAPTLDTLRAQARLQAAQNATGEASYELLAPLPARGFALLPVPSAGDVFFDMEGDPYFEGGGLEYLFGAAFADVTPYRAWWGHSHAEERQAFEAFIDFVVARRAADPAMHVYHYAPYEPTALKRLAGRYGSREAELDDLLRGEVLIDLYRVVRQGLRASYPSYSIKDIEHFYMGPREAAVKNAGASIVEYELWLETHEAAKLEAIERYNEEDCVSTRLLRDWLMARKAEVVAKFGEPVPGPVKENKPLSEQRVKEDVDRAALIARLVTALDPDPTTLKGSERGRWLLAQLVEYHQREARPAWWAYFDRLQMTEEELHDDSEAIAGLEPDLARPPRPLDQSQLHTLRFGPQEFKLKGGAQVIDPVTGKSPGTLFKVDARSGRIELKRGKSFENVPLPTAVIPNGPIPNYDQRAAILRIATAVADGGMAGAGPYRALRDLLSGAPPRVTGIPPGAALHGAHLDPDQAWKLVSALDESTLFIQGPPGAGKTWLGARLIVRLMREGKTVGVTALSHRAIHNLLHEVEAVAHAEGFEFCGLKKSSSDRETEFASKLSAPLITNSTANASDVPRGMLLLAGTAWLFSHADLESTRDFLFIDEAGQVSLADALAVGTAASNLVLLGDPQQLPQVSQAVHPQGAGASVLEHILGVHDTIPPDRGLFLDQTWRMHPAVCDFISDLAYEGRLASAPGRERQVIASPRGLAGVGLRYVPVSHSGNSQRSVEEAEVVAHEIELLLEGGSFTDDKGVVSPLTLGDILIVAPYNAQVQTLLEHLPNQAQVGTVDKFQGREAAVVFFSMATSSGDDLPRDIAFLFSRNRLNVAISRARALAILVASPRLLHLACRNADEMQMVNGVARLVEVSAGFARTVQ